jgi:hypothetical protein
MEIISITTKKNKIFEKILEKCLDEIKDKQIKNEEYVLFCVPKVMRMYRLCNSIVIPKALQCAKNR